MDPNQLPPEQEKTSILDKFPLLKKRSVQAIVLLVIAVVMIIPLCLFVISSFKGESPSTQKKNEPAPIDPFSVPYVKDELVVKYKDQYTIDEILNLKKELDRVGVEESQSLFNSEDPSLKNFYVLKFKKGVDVKRAKEELDKLPEIEFVGPNSISKVNVTPNDTYFPNQWDMDQIKMPTSWDITKGSTSITVAVVDTGIDYNNPDFSGRSIRGYDFVNNDSNPMDDMGHGTHVAGTIGAVTNNNLGVAGINWDVTLLAVKVMNAQGSGTTSNIAEGIQYAADNGAKVINMSLTAGLPCSQYPQYSSAINYAVSKGAVVVVAAGNDNKDASSYSPASCGNVITVGASTQSDGRATFSNYGSTVDIAAPGVQILSTKASACNTMCTSANTVGVNYSYSQGTSMAAPHVAGAAGLLVALKGLSPAQVKSCLVDNADPISTDKPIGKRMNVLNALNACSGLAPVTPIPTTAPTPGVTNTPIPQPQPQPSTIPSSSSISVNVIVDANGNRQVDGGEPGFQGAQINITGPVNRAGTTDPLGRYVFSNLPAGHYTIAISIPGLTIQPAQYDLLANQALTYTLLIPAQAATITPTPVGTTPPAGNSPAPLPSAIPTIIVSPTRIPTVAPKPKTTYSCRMNTGTKTPSGAISIGNLICTPNTPI